MVAMGQMRYAGLLSVLIVAVHGREKVKFEEITVTKIPFFYEGTPAHVTETPSPPTFTTTPLISIPPFEETAETAGGVTVTVTPAPGEPSGGGLSNGAKIGIGVVGGTAAAAGIALGGILIHNSIKKKEAAALTTTKGITSDTLFGPSFREDDGPSFREDDGPSFRENDGPSFRESDNGPSFRESDNGPQFREGNNGPQFREDGTESSPSSHSWMFWLILMALICCLVAGLAAAFFVLKKKKKKSRGVKGKKQVAPADSLSTYPASPETDTMPLIAPPMPVVEAGPLTDSRVKIQASEVITAPPVYYTAGATAAPITTFAAPSTIYSPSSIYTTPAPITTIAAPITTAAPVYYTGGQPTANFGTTLTVPSTMAAPTVL